MEKNVTVYDENVLRWSNFFPEAVVQLKLLNSDRRPLKVIKEGSEPVNLQTTVEGVDYFYHDPKDPRAEAKELLKKIDFEVCDILYVYGVGLGYVFDELKEWLEAPGHTLVLFEDQLTIIDEFLHTQRAKEVLAHPRVWLYYLNNNLKDFENFVKMFVMQRPKVLPLPLYDQLYNRRIGDLNTQISFLRNIHHGQAAEYKGFGLGFFVNYFHNLYQWPKAYHGDGLFQKFSSVPAIICGAGPSLSKNIELLATLKDKAIIFAGGSAMNAVNAAGIIPHFGVGIDPNIEQSTRIIMNKAFDTPFFYRSRINHEALKLVTGDLLYLSGNSGYEVASFFDKEVGIEPTTLEEGCNVINFSLDIAEKMGCNPIILVGVDLAYSNDQSYAKGLTNHPIHPGKKLFRTKEQTEELINYMDINGLPVFTLWKWISESLWFSHFASSHPHIKIVNATEGGIGFNGIPNMTLKEAADTLLKEQYDFNARIFGEVQDHPMPPKATYESIVDLIQTFAKSLERAVALLQEEISSTIQNVNADSKDASQDYEDAFRTMAAGVKSAELKEEIAYRFLLAKFEEAYNTLHRCEYWRLNLDAEYDSPIETDRKRLDYKVQLLNYLNHTAKSVLQLIQGIVKIQADQVKILAEAESVVESSERSNITNDGTSTYAFENGKLTLIDPEFDLKYEDKFIPKEEDKCRLLDDAGKLKHEYYLRNGKLHGPSRFYNPKGRLLVENWYIDGQLQGKSIQYFASGELYGIQRFRNGVKHGKQDRYFKNGFLRSSTPYKSGVLDGEVLLYYANGVKARSLIFVDGKRQGMEQFWNVKGLLTIQAEFKDDLPTGTSYLWYDNGTLAQEAKYGDKGENLSLQRWTSTGVEINESQWQRLDYFEDIAVQTGALTNSLSEILEQATNVAQIVSQTSENKNSGLVDDLGGLSEEFDVLKKELEKLKTLQELLHYESGLDAKNPHEAIWKTPSIQREFQQKLDGMTKQLQDGVSKLHTSFSHTVDEIKSKQIKKEEQAPPPNNDE